MGLVTEAGSKKITLPEPETTGAAPPLGSEPAAAQSATPGPVQDQPS